MKHSDTRLRGRENTPYPLPSEENTPVHDPNVAIILLALPALSSFHLINFGSNGRRPLHLRHHRLTPRNCLRSPISLSTAPYEVRDTLLIETMRTVLARRLGLGSCKAIRGRSSQDSLKTNDILTSTCTRRRPSCDPA